ncbi:hypothetical protein LTR36_004321 [Oleoguttula mirabilis]|uniref:Protein kinase domain-containing protein n=1 Tax=Oleoguttula mirabilis TaxID=1507867 RepID=A0AAV9JGF7_9PEZI|nr:hypothetical protein LTR36_004321 [Oleoguttula mirabilis]
MEANRLLAEKAHVSALRMEEMTHEMQIIAHKTKAETVSMRIITLVTLFFLPGTFISVSPRRQHAERYYSTEVHNFAQLTSRASTSTPGLIGFYGGFEHGDTFNILLEYANGGTLEDMFQQREPPSCGDDIIAFWNAFVEVLKALASIHDLKKEASDTMGHKVFQGYVV